MVTNVELPITALKGRMPDASVELMMDNEACVISLDVDFSPSGRRFRECSKCRSKFENPRETFPTDCMALGHLQDLHIACGSAVGLPESNARI